MKNLIVFDPPIVARAQAELEQIRKVEQEYATRTVIVPWMIEEPTGQDRLRRLAQAMSASAGMP